MIYLKISGANNNPYLDPEVEEKIGDELIKSMETLKESLKVPPAPIVNNYTLIKISNILDSLNLFSRNRLENIKVELGRLCKALKELVKGLGTFARKAAECRKWGRNVWAAIERVYGSAGALFKRAGSRSTQRQ